MSSVERPCPELGKVMVQAWLAGCAWLQDIQIRCLLKQARVSRKSVDLLLSI